jgi:hypothetical protein
MEKAEGFKRGKEEIETISKRGETNPPYPQITRM